MWRVSPSPSLSRSSLKSGREPDHACSARAWRKPGTMTSPASSISCTWSRAMSMSSGLSAFSSVVPMTQTVRMGTRMSPSPGCSQRLTTVETSRWFMAIMTPLPGTTVTPGQSAMSAIWPAQMPLALTVKPASIRTSSPPRSSRATAPATRSPSRRISFTQW